MAAGENHLLEMLPRRDRLRLLALSEPTPLILSDVLVEAGQPTRHVYFPTDGFVSLVAATNGGPGVEVGMVGREGMVGIQLALGVASVPLRALVQGPGVAHRIAAGPFRKELARNEALRRGLNRYLSVLMSQLSTSAVCLRFHVIGPRLARWLLMSQDRAHAECFHVTQEFLAFMLGVRRVGITRAASDLQRCGLIAYHRGEVIVLDRSGLESAACNCYAQDRHDYAELLRLGDRIPCRVRRSSGVWANSRFCRCSMTVDLEPSNGDGGKVQPPRSGPVPAKAAGWTSLPNRRLADGGGTGRLPSIRTEQRFRCPGRWDAASAPAPIARTSLAHPSWPRPIVPPSRATRS